jgi:hypothetical protein
MGLDPVVKAAHPLANSSDAKSGSAGSKKFRILPAIFSSAKNEVELVSPNIR